ncbi:hypothetical protein CPB84DRAFT_1788228 [Gymnopilus junonius]|uniref:Uncharacterized protein n=1 Tax=Gymnopilus junonius TaxID=109634 RepID=A0A9P5NED9_GYMJU|nr:hypothetical protein CPB84DRAFT_1788228 [Gymnopilus junonius]
MERTGVSHHLIIICRITYLYMCQWTCRSALLSSSSPGLFIYLGSLTRTSTQPSGGGWITISKILATVWWVPRCYVSVLVLVLYLSLIW